MNLGIIIQARMNSTRLPGKVLKDIAGKTLLNHVLDRLALLKHPFKAVVATSDLPKDDVIVSHCKINDVSVFRGSEDNVLDRYYQCALTNKFEHVVRLTADNPFTDIEELYRLIEYHINQKNDYTHSFGIMPVGVGAEIFTFQALEKSAQQAFATNHLEHVNEYIQEHADYFRIGILEIPLTKHSANLRLTVDNQEDFHRACFIAERFPHKLISTEELISLCLQYA